MIRPAMTLSALLMVLSCSSEPARRVYVLGGAAQPVANVRSEAGRPVVAMKPVTLPDYLDTTEISLRGGQNELKSSSTGRWGERLSVGVARALNEDLSNRLPGAVIAQGDQIQPPSRTLLVDIDAFDIRADGPCVLAARWTVLGDDNKTIIASRRATIVVSLSRSGDVPEDLAIVTAMANAVAQLADHIAADLIATLRGTGPRPTGLATPGRQQNDRAR